mmetsp:Transcript_32287/g.84482  ORF Transcript_32287/g.84482 Transcript_32287/m.84482 type:complete len:152 (+) Transcript_32287:56-511(+)
MAGGPAVTDDELRRFTTSFYGELGSGKITVEYVKQLADTVTGDYQSIPLDRLQAIVAKLDEGGGSFNFKKLLVLLADEIEIPDDRAELERSFKAYDENRDGRLSKAELMKALRSIPTHSLNPQELADIVDRCDIDGDGELDLDEIVKAVAN